MIAFISGFLDLLVYVLAFIVILSVIVFIHEFGHFQVARWCGVRVDVFSIGFGKRLAGWNDSHGTLWQISALPLGGYVKFFGDSSAASTPDTRVAASNEASGTGSKQGGMTRFLPQDDKSEIASQLSEEEKAVCFHFKPVWARVAVVLAGPMANFILAIAIFSTLFAIVGNSVIEPRVGGVLPDSPAASAGLETGDLILSVNGKKINTFNKLSMIIAMSSKEKLPVAIARGETEMTLTIEPIREERTDAFGNKVKTGFLGIYSYTAPEVARVLPGSLGAQAGFLPGDQLISVGDTAIHSFSEFNLAALAIGEFPVSVGIVRSGDPLDLVIRPAANTEELIFSRDTWGADLGLIPPSAVTRVSYNPIEAVHAGVVRTADMISTTFTYMGRLILGKEDISQMGGPLKIGQYAGQAAKIGFTGSSSNYMTTISKIKTSALSLLQLAALISVSIGFLNLLPVPLLDGGHLMYYAYEAVFGKPLSMQVQMVGNIVGATILGILMIVVFKNDLTQLFFNRV